MRLPSYFVIHMLVLGLACGGVCCHRLSHRAEPAQSVQVEREPVPRREENPPEIWVTDSEDAGGITRPMPSKALEGQKKPNAETGKCEADEVAISGGCWVEVVRKPGKDGCGSKFFESQGKCYLPVAPKPRLPTSMEP